MEAIPSDRSFQNSFEEQLQSAEKRARDKYLFALEEMQDVRLPAWFHRLLERRIIPSLIRMGFDELLAWALFKMAAPAWELMGPITDEEIWFHPVLMRNIREIRKGILSKRVKISSVSQCCLEWIPKIYFHGQERMRLLNGYFPY